MGIKKQKTAFIVIILLALFSLFAPMPYYSSGDAHCIMGSCTKKGWYLNGSLWDRIVWKVQYPDYTKERSIPIPAPKK